MSASRRIRFFVVYQKMAAELPVCFTGEVPPFFAAIP